LSLAAAHISQPSINLVKRKSRRKKKKGRSEGWGGGTEKKKKRPTDARIFTPPAKGRGGGRGFVTIRK